MTDIKNYDGKIVVNTRASMHLQTAKLMGLPVDYPDKSTINDNLDILKDRFPAADTYATAKYMCIGDRGHQLSTDNTGDTIGLPIAHSPSDVVPYRMRPFVLRPIDNDLSDDVRARYALRRMEEHGGKRYWAYYLIRLNFAGVKVNDYSITVTAGVKDIVNSVYTDVDLYPVRPAIPDFNYDFSDQTVTADGKYEASNAVISLNMNEYDIQEYLNVCKILNGSPLKSVISELCLVAGVDTLATGESYTGVPFQYNEVMAAQVMMFVTTFTLASMSNNGINYTVVVGQTTPVPVRATTN